MIIPNTKRHPNNTKTDQLPVFDVITGLPRPYHNIHGCFNRPSYLLGPGSLVCGGGKGQGGNASYIFQADMFPVTAAEFTAEGTANVLVNKYIPLWGCPRTILSDNGPQFCSKLSQAVYRLLGVRKPVSYTHLTLPTIYSV